MGTVDRKGELLLINASTWQCIVQLNRSIDGFHGSFYHGNWRALHHHSACWLVNIHITWPFALQFLWWKMLWNLTIVATVCGSHTSIRATTAGIYMFEWSAERVWQTFQWVLGQHCGFYAWVPLPYSQWTKHECWLLTYGKVCKWTRTKILFY